MLSTVRDFQPFFSPCGHSNKQQNVTETLGEKKKKPGSNDLSWQGQFQAGTRKRVILKPLHCLLVFGWFWWNESSPQQQQLALVIYRECPRQKSSFSNTYSPQTTPIDRQARDRRKKHNRGIEGNSKPLNTMIYIYRKPPNF